MSESSVVCGVLGACHHGVAFSIRNQTNVSESGTLIEQIRALRKLERDSCGNLHAGANTLLPGNACFLDDGRVLCRERERGDSRFPYSCNGLTFWVHSSGYMYANDGLFFLFLPAHEGYEPPIAFFAGQRTTQDRFQPISLLPVPHVDQAEAAIRNRYAVLGPDAAYFVTETDTLAAAVRVFVAHDSTNGVQLVFSVQLESLADDARQTYVSGYLNPFCRHQFAETFEDRWFKRIRAESTSAGEPTRCHRPLPPFVVSVNEDISRFRSVTNLLVVQRGLTATQESTNWELETQVCTSRRAYTGSPRRGLAQAVFLRTGSFQSPVTDTVFNDNAVVGDLNRFCLPPGVTVRFDYVLSLPEDETALNRVLNSPATAPSVDEAHRNWSRALQQTPRRLRMRFAGCRLEGISDDTLNRFVPFLITQVQVCAENKGYMHPSPNSLIGFRDVFQAIEGQLFDRPQAARAKMREALSFVGLDGRCPRQYSLPVHDQPGRADLREFIDQGSWAVSTVHTYVANTGDNTFLDEQLGYHRISPNDAQTLELVTDTDSVIEHLIRIMDYYLRHRDPETGLLRVLYGDWNDALDGLGTTSTPGDRFGSGVSVMASLHLYRNCAEMLDLLTRFYPTRHTAQVDRYRRARAGMRDAFLRFAISTRGDERRIVHGWGDARAYYVGSHSDSDGRARDGLTSNAFWVLCGMLNEDPSLRADILAALDRLDSPYGLRSFDPGFAPDAPGVGRIPKLPIGTAENGATYVHATAFGIMALFAMNEPRRAWEQIYKILPFSPHQQGLSHSPFVMPNSYVHNPELGLTGQNMNDWHTGCSNVLLKALIWYVFGFRPEFDGLRIAPATWSPLDKLELSAVAHDRRVRLVLARGNVDERRCRVNGALTEASPDSATGIPGIMVPYGRLVTDGENLIEIQDPE